MQYMIVQEYKNQQIFTAGTRTEAGTSNCFGICSLKSTETIYKLQIFFQFNFLLI